MRLFDRKAKGIVEVDDKFKRVYQGGHHDVWCDGSNHLNTSGGWTRLKKPDPPHLNFRTGCDCARWARFNSTLDRPHADCA